MSAFVLDWLNLVVRWAHLVVGIGWIGTSFYFIALDLSLRKRDGTDAGVAGTAWQVHGGGFYRVDKHLVAPKDLPPDLTWFRWEAYLTWATGFALLGLQYYWSADVYLIDPAVLPLEPAGAVAIAIASTAAGWLVYEALCRSPLSDRPATLAAAVFALIVAAAYLYAATFSGRGALIHVGSLIGTIMAVNVFAVIIPNQKKIVAALIAGRPPDPRLGAVAKQRSVHNNHLTLPVLVLMVGGHYPMLSAHRQTYLVVALIVIVGASVRHFLNRHDAGDPLARIAWALPIAGLALAAAVYLTAPRADPAMAAMSVSEAEALAIVDRHCVMCHSANPSHPGFAAAPAGVVLTDASAIVRQADRIIEQAVHGNAMPLGNETGMTGDERRRLGAFLRSR